MKHTFTLVMLVIALPSGRAQAVTPSDTPCSADFMTTGIYRNYSFGFTLTIPRGLKAIWSSPPCGQEDSTSDCICMNDHGRAIPLPGGGTINIYADHNAMAWTLPTIVRNDIGAFKGQQAGSRLTIVALDRIKWNAMPAYRYVARNEMDGEITVRESVVVIRHDDMIVLNIEAPESQYCRYQATFNTLLRSWRPSSIQ